MSQVPMVVNGLRDFGCSVAIQLRTYGWIVGIEVTAGQKMQDIFHIF